MDVLSGLVGFVVVVALFVGVVVGVVAYLRTVVRATGRGSSWVRTVPRIGLPLYLGCLCSHLVLAPAPMRQGMGDWYLLINGAAVVSASIALVHFFIAARVHRGDSTDRILGLGLLAVVVSPCLLVAALGIAGNR